MTKQQEYLKRQIIQGEECIAAIKQSYENLWQIELLVNAYKIALNFQGKGFNNE